MDQLERKAAQERQVDLLLFQIDEWDSDFIAERPQGRLFGHEAKIDGRHIEPRRLRPIEPELAKLLGRQEAALDENRACFHGMFRGERAAGWIEVHYEALGMGQQTDVARPESAMGVDRCPQCDHSVSGRATLGPRRGLEWQADLLAADVLPKVIL